MMDRAGGPHHMAESCIIAPECLSNLEQRMHDATGYQEDCIFVSSAIFFHAVPFARGLTFISLGVLRKRHLGRVLV